MKRALKLSIGMVIAALVLTFGSAGLLVVSARMSADGMPAVVGHKVLAVVSGSMEPAIRTGDIILVKPVTDIAQDVTEGTVITYRSPERDDLLITHRVKKSVLLNGQPMGYVTQGDANATPDKELVTPEQVVGVYQSRVPYIGYVTAFLFKALGIVALTVSQSPW